LGCSCGGDGSGCIPFSLSVGKPVNQ
jgi:hypothetical protein